jgi:AcrR family transcriptional regulator
VRAAVIAATLAELAESGYSALSIDSVARRAGIHKTTLYRRWGTREDLVLEVMLESAGSRVSIADTGSLRSDLYELLRTAAANATTAEVEAMIRAYAAQSPHDAGLAAAGRRFWSDRLALDGAIVERAIARGDISASVDPRQVIESVLGPIYLRLLLTGEPLDQTFLRATVDLVIDGLRTTVPIQETGSPVEPSGQQQHG